MTILTVDMLPTRAVCWHDESNILAGAALTKTANALQRHTFYAYQNVAGNGNTFTQSVFLRAGTYTLTILGITENDSPLVDWYFDGVIVASAQDWYSAGTTYNVEKNVTVVVSFDGKHVLKGVVNGKNGASSAYALRLTRFAFKQASD